MAPSSVLKLPCGLFGTWEWMDGMPVRMSFLSKKNSKRISLFLHLELEIDLFNQVTFNFPMAKSPDKSSFVLELNDGTVTSPV